MTLSLRTVGILMLVVGLTWLGFTVVPDGWVWGVPLGLAIGVLLIWMFKIRPANTRLALLHAGKHDEFHAVNDKALTRARHPRTRAVLMMNKAAAFAQVGDMVRGVEIQDQVDVQRLRGTVKGLYYLNLLHMLAHSDPERARAVRAEHTDLLDPESNPKLKPHLADVARTYELMVDGDLSGEDYFRARIRDTDGVQRAFAHYHLAVLLARRGALDAARRTYEAGREYWPALQLPSPVPST